ncbi:MAG: HEAT repeat domain-containing protein [Syntrophaceae bacterium]|nr:HEAT repeat domain-containing protein [Syntrophaceae bacterium]
MADRFRLIYLKSSGSEETDFNVSSSSSGDRRTDRQTSSIPEFNLLETISSDRILKQAQADLKHPDSKVRILAIKYYLEKSYPSIPLSLLQEFLSDQEAEIRTEALCCLIKFRSPIVLPLLKKHLRDRDPKVRVTALRGLFRYQEKIDFSILLQFLSDESIWVRRKVATLLGWAQIDGALPILVELSRDQNATVRKAALFSLSTLYPDESENRLMEAMTDSDPNLRTWARMTLEKIASRPLKRGGASMRGRV